MKNVTEICQQLDNNLRMDCISSNVQDNLENIVVGLDLFFLIFAAVLVFLMQAGFAMVCAGAVREKNVQNTMLKNLLDACGAALAFWSIGYAIAYGGEASVVNFTTPEIVSNSTTFLGTKNYFLQGMDGQYSFWFFQYAFAATTTTIVAGTLAERCQMVAYFAYSVVLTSFVYPVIVHAVWSQSGFLSARSNQPLWSSGAVDFSGSGVVHVTGGFTALLAALILGPRKGRFYDDGGNVLKNPTRIKGHSISLQMLGTMLLWFGWYGFNTGSVIMMHSKPAAHVGELTVVNTTLGAACGCISALFLSAFLSERSTGEVLFDVTHAMNGCLSGLVSITAGCAVLEPWAAVVIGSIAGPIYILFSNLLVRWKIDDAVDAIPVHLAGGTWGLLAVGLLAHPDHLRALSILSHPDFPEDGRMNHVGWFYSFSRKSSDATLLGLQCIELLFIVGLVLVVMGPFFLVLNYAGYFRSDPLDEIVGLDRRYREARTGRDESHKLINAGNGSESV